VSRRRKGSREVPLHTVCQICAHAAPGPKAGGIAARCARVTLPGGDNESDLDQEDEGDYWSPGRQRKSSSS
jgi:hypothetical protein